MILVEMEICLIGLVSLAQPLLAITVSSLSCNRSTHKSFLILVLEFHGFCDLCREVFSMSIVGNFPMAVTNLLDLIVL